MSDPGLMSDDEILQALKQAKAAGNVAAATHATGTYQPSGYIPNDPTAEMGTFARLRAGTGRGMMNIGRNVANLASYASPDLTDRVNTEVAIDNAKDIDKPLMNTRAGTIGSMLGETAVTAPLTMGASMGVGASGSLGSALINNPLGRGAFEGAVQGLVTSPPGDRLSGTLRGGAAGAALPAAAGIGRLLARGVNPTPSARMLRQMGVDLTPGQMNPEGIANSMEQAWQSVPVAGNIIKNARGSAEAQFQQAALQQGSAPGASIAKQADLNAMLDDAYKSFGPAYDAARTSAVPGTSSAVARALAGTVNDPAVLADDASRGTVGRWLENQATQLPKGQALSSGDFLDLRSKIREKIRNITDDQQRELLENAENALTQHLNNHLPPDIASGLAATDAQYSKYKVLENVLRKAGDRPEGFSPSQFSQAIKEATDAGSYARGGGQLRDMASAGRDVFNTVSPATGARNAAIGIPLAAAAAKPVIGVPLIGAGLGLTGTQYGRQLAAGERPFQQLMQSIGSGVQSGTTKTQRELIAEYLRRLSVAPAVQPAVSDTGSP